jgi:phospholipid-binding lipoprotein MlaA
VYFPLFSDICLIDSHTYQKFHFCLARIKIEHKDTTDIEKTYNAPRLMEGPFMLKKLTLLTLPCFLMACATIPGEPEPHDPWERFNRTTFAFNDKLDKAILRPTAKAYDTVVPKAVDERVDSALSNLGEPITILNDVLQLKLGQAAQDTARFVLNSTFGVLGFFDVASGIGLEEHDEDFGQTLGYWGVPAGPYVVIPFYTPSTLRDTPALFVDGAVRNDYYNEIDIDTFEERIGITALSVVNARQSLLGIDTLADDAPDPYIFVRESFLQRREALVKDQANAGAPAEFELDEDDEASLFDEDF